MCYCIGYIILIVGLAVPAYLGIGRLTGWQPYAVWLGAMTLTTFIVYGLDKKLSKVDGPRAPELILNLLALAGGFVGGWLGLFLFDHKSNIRKHFEIWLVLLISTLAHGVLAYYLLVAGGGGV